MARPRRLAFDLILQRPFQNVDDLFARMGVLDQRRFRADVDARLDHLASGDVEVVLLEIGAPESWRLLDRHDHSSFTDAVSGTRLAAPRRTAAAPPRRRSGRPCRPR